MSKIDLGWCGVFPWTNVYELYPNKLLNFNGVGGYIIQDNMCYVMAKGSGSGVISLPTPKNITDITIFNITNDEQDTLSFVNGELTLKNNCEYLVNFYYEV